MAADGSAGGRAIAGHDIDDAVRKACFLGQLRHAQGRQRRLLGRLEDDGAACGQRRAPFPRLHQRGEVPGDDLADHADRLVPRVAKVIALDRDGFAVNLVCPTRVIAVAFARHGQVDVEGIAIGLAVVQRFEGRQLLAICFDEIGKPVKQAATFRGVHLRPRTGFKRLAGCLDRQVHIRLFPLGNLADDLAGGRVYGRECFPRGAILPFAADKERPVFDLGRLARGRLLAGRCSHAGILLC